MAKIDTEITNLATPWNNYKGKRVEEFIKKQLGGKAGYLKVVSGSDGSSQVMAAFADENAFQEWNSLEDSVKWEEQGLAHILSYTTLPSLEQGDVYNINLQLESTPAQIQADAHVNVRIKATSSVAYGAGGTDTVQEDLILEIQTRTSTTAAYTTRGRVSFAANGDYIPVSLAAYLFAGTNYVRIRAVGEYATSIWRSFTLNVVALSLAPNTAFEVPMTGDTLSLNYLVGGAIAKTIQFEFGYGLGNDFAAQYSYMNGDPGCSRSVGTTTNLSTGITYEFTDANMLADIMSSGAHTVRARLYVSETVKTDWVESQYMVSRDAAAEVPAIVLNNIHDRLDNWTDVNFFNFAVFTAGAGSMRVRFRLVDSADQSKEYASWTQEVEDNISYTLSTQLGIELDDPGIEEFYAYMMIDTPDDGGVVLTTPVFFTFGNSASYTPTAGADLIIQPSDRANSEANPRTVINKATGQEVPSSWEGFGMVTDGWMDVNKNVDSTAASAETVRALHIPAGRKLTVDYNPFADFMSGNNTGRHVTIEMDFRTNNILDEDEPIIQMCSTYAADGRAWGLELLPKEVYMLTQRKRALDDQNATWAEGVRTHLAVNIVYGLSGLNYVRIFINGTIEREFNYASNDIFVGEEVSMKFGNTTSDLDIFGIRVYKKSLSTTEVMQDRKAAFSTVAEKIAFAEANDILGDDGSISFSKAKEKYRVLGLTGHLAKYGDENKGKTEGCTLYHSRPGDPKHTGTLTEEENSGQGTTAMTYYDWNQQQKHTDGSLFIPDNDPDNPVSIKDGWSWKDGEAASKKNNGKINFASSMQGHKMGMCKIYTEVFKRLVAMGVMSEPSQVTRQPNARLAVYEEPYLFFHRETANDPWVFKYLMTWGAGKGDKPTFGYSNSATPRMLMLEGANNDRPLALFRIPWNDDVTYSPADEAWMYNGQKQLNFGFGHTAKNAAGEEYPDNAEAIAAHQAFFNFNYLHHQRISYFSGTLSQLRNSDSVDKSRFYWVTTADASLNSAQYDLYRYDEITGNWVDAGIAKLGTGRYEKLNLRTQYEAFGGTSVWTQGQWKSINDSAIARRTIHFKNNASTYMHVDDCLYHSGMIKFFAGTDNRAKNTYYYTDPDTLKIRHYQDDTDTIMKTNNVGQNRKPYYVEEHDTNASGEFYWQGEESGYYNLLETAFEDELTAMMNNIFTAMASLGGSAMDYLESRMLEAQDYFPAIAYNEQARLVYEAAAVAQEAGAYVNTSVQAITQSVGSQRWSEYDWLKNRVMYLSSWCEYGEFAGSSSAANGLSWRGKNGAVYDFKLTTAKWLYPRVGSDSGNYPASASGKRVRVPAGQTIDYPTITLSSDSWISIRGINYFLDLGDMNVGVSSDQGTFAFYGKLLQKIEVNPDGADTNLMLANSIAIANATNIKSIRIRGVNTATGEIDLSKCARLESIDLRGSTFALAELPASERLGTVHFPASLTTLRIDAQPNLETVDFEGVQYLSTIYVDQARAGSFDTGLLALNIYNAKHETGGLSSVKFYNVDWSDVRADTLMFYSNSSVCEITGSVSMLPAASDRYLTFIEIQSLVDRFGDIQSASNGVFIDYPKRTITSFNVKGRKYIKTTGTFNGWQLNILPSSGNNVAIANGREAVQWSFTGSNAAQAATYAEFTDNVRGVLNVKQLSDPSIDLTFTIRVQITLVGGGVLTFDKKVGFYNRIPKINDFAYVDGTFDDEYDASKTLAGAVTRVTKISDDEYECEVYAKENTVAKSTDNSINTSDLPWAIYPDESGASGFPASFYNEIRDAAELASAIDLPMDNITSSGIPNADGTSTSYNYVRDSFLDSTKDDGYAQIATGGAAADFAGKTKNDIIVNHAKAIIERYLQETYPNNEDIKIPTTLTELADAMVALQAENSEATSPSRYRQLFCPAAFAAYLYQPSVAEGEELDEQYAKTKWHLPAPGSLARIYNFFYNSCGRVTYDNGGRISETYANEAPESEALLPLFANLLKRIRAVTTASPFTMLTNSAYWSSTEYYGGYAWGMGFNSGDVYIPNKSVALTVRPVAAYRFHL